MSAACAIDLEEWAPASGCVIAGRYVLRSQRGSGGMGIVWEAEHVALKRRVAVKFLNIERCDARVLQARFLREARAAAAIHHRNVVDIIDFGATSSGQPFMVMELLEGRSLDALLDAPDPIGAAEIVRIATGVLSGLAAVHAAGLLHGDIKPDNVFLVREQETEVPKLLDFGVSRAQHGQHPRGDERESVVPTIEGLVLGTPAYMSPEQARGEADLDARADVYSLGVLLYELLSRRVPFDGASVAEVITQVLRDDAVPLEQLRPDLPHSLTEVIAKAMSRDKANRFETADAMRTALAGAIDVPSLQAEPAPRLHRRSLATIDAIPEDAEILPDVPSASTPPPPVPLGPSRGVLAVLSGALLVGVAALLASFTQSPSDARAEHVTPPVAPAPPPHEPTTPAEVAVELASLPDGALVYVDGVPAEPPLALPADGQAHVIEVRAEGYQPWVVSHVPTSAARLDVRAVRRPPRATEASVSAIVATPQSAPRAPRRTSASARLIRSPDF